MSSDKILTLQAIAAHNFTHNMTAERNGASVCHCFHCFHRFSSTKIVRYTKYGDAICPKCNVDSVLSEQNKIFKVTKALLKEMHRVWFTSVKRGI